MAACSSKIEYLLTAGTTYYIKLRHYSSTGSVYAQMRVENDFDSTRSGATPTTWDKIDTGQLSSRYDVDYFSLPQLTTLSAIHLNVTSNAVTLEDQSGNSAGYILSGRPYHIQTYFHANYLFCKSMVRASTAATGQNVDALADVVDYSISSRKTTPESQTFSATPSDARSANISFSYWDYHPDTTVEIFDSIGQLVHKVNLGPLAGSSDGGITPTTHQYTWNGRLVGSSFGAYYPADNSYFARDGVYTVVITPTDVPQYPAVGEVTVENRKPVILVAGVGGTKLNNSNNDLIWISNWILYTPQNSRIEQLFLTPDYDGSTEVHDLNQSGINPIDQEYGLMGIRQLNDSTDQAKQYDYLIGDLQAQNYQIGTTLFGLPYDWRFDLRKHQDRVLPNQSGNRCFRCK